MKKNILKRNKAIGVLAMVGLVGGLLLIPLVNSQQNTSITTDTDLVIIKKAVSQQVKIYPYKSGDIYMEILAVKASDGSIRTAFNTCRSCNSSGKGHYLQKGNKLYCQNCTMEEALIDKVGLVDQDCYPVPILKTAKTEDSEEIVVSKDFLTKNRNLFSQWSKR